MKITLSRIFETSKALATPAGQELSDVIDFISQLGEQTLRALRNGITFEDNVRCITQRVTLEDGKTQIVSTNGKVPTKVLVTRVISTVHGLSSFLWYLDAQNRLTVKCGFSDLPTSKIDVELLIFYV